MQKRKLLLIMILLLAPLLTQGQALPSPQLGVITQVEGDITFLNFSPPKLSHIQPKEPLLAEGSYLTNETSFFTTQIFDGSWLRVSPQTKFSLEFDAEQKTLTLHLFTGSVKVLFSTHLNQGKLQKFLVKTGDGVFETVEAKFSVVRNLITDESSVYVEKGLVQSTRSHMNEKVIAYIHSLETLALKDRDPEISGPRAISDKELRFLNSRMYLKKQNSEL